MNSRREAILREMGLAPLWKLRTSPQAEVQSAVSQPLIPVPTAVPAAVLLPQAPPASARPARVPSPVNLSPPVSSPVVAASDVSQLGWEALAEQVAACQACSLCRRRKQAVFGVGNRQAPWLFVGEGPGAEEDERGEPFVGEAGKLLDAMLYAIGLSRQSNVYIANTVKCRPPGNRTPEAQEMAACFPYLERQIALIQPKLIVAVGRPAAQTLLGKEVKIADVRGRLLAHRGIPLIVTYHPAYLLRNLPHKARAWEDLCFIRRTMASLG